MAECTRWGVVIAAPAPFSCIMSFADSESLAMWNPSSKIEVLPTVLMVVYAPVGRFERQGRRELLSMTRSSTTNRSAASITRCAER